MDCGTKRYSTRTKWDDVDLFKADIFSMGVTLFKAATGKRI
jgi:hypothetical protein